MFIRHLGDYHWENVSVLNYKEEGGCFKSITRQILLNGVPELPCQLRYFEVAPGGYSTLEQHQHVHFVVIFRGSGKVLLGDRIYQTQEKDVIEISSLTWHQFRAIGDVPLGFLCLVATDRDKPILPTEEDLKSLRQDPDIAAFIRV